MTESQHLHDLNPEQRTAVTHTAGPLLILAGAGTGKTKTLVHRIAHLIRHADVPPARILAVTFTNRAASEMRERVHSYVGEEARRITLGTFHSLGVRILREHGARLGLPARFAIYATGDQLGALKAASAEVHVLDDAFDLKRVLWRISDWKSKRITPAQARTIVASGVTTGTRADDYAILAADVYPRYEETLRAAGAVDFDDLLLLPVQLLEEHEDVRLALWKRWHHVMIDEYQDTNPVQLDLARLLAGTRRNICVVGDDDQSIYAFRGADVGNILEFERHFPGARVVTLETNYRSTSRILGAANAIIAANTQRHAKRLRSSLGTGAPVLLLEHDDDAAEAEGIADEITRRRMMHRLRWGDVAVLYRANAQARPFEEAFRQKNIPYRVIGGLSFFERREVADAIAYLRAVVNPADEIAVRRIINVPTRGIGRQTVLRIADLARERKTTFAQVLDSVGTAEVGAPAARAIAGFLELLAHARTELATAEREAARAPTPAEVRPPIAEWALRLFDWTGLEASLHADPRNARSIVARTDNLKDLAGAITRYERRVWADRLGLTGTGADADLAAEWSPPTLGDALDRLALADMEDREDDERENEQASVALLTLHSAKGLEFRDVFIVGVEEGILPHTRSIDAAAADPADQLGAQTDPLSEERRLFYVGVTRARERLTLSWCRARRRGAAATDVLPSRYLDEIPEAVVERRARADKTATPERSEELKKNFFAHMREILAE